MNLLSDICSVYFIHYSKLADRLPLIRQNLSLLGLAGIDDCLINEHLISKRLVSHYVSSSACNSVDLVSRQLPLILYPTLLNVDKSLAETSKKLPQDISPKQVLNLYPFIKMNPPSAPTIEHCLQHYYAMARFLLDDTELCLILEDDAIFSQDKQALLEVLRYSTELSRKSPGGCFFDLSNGCNLTPSSDESDMSSHISYYDRLNTMDTRCIYLSISMQPLVSFLILKMSLWQLIGI